jgi:hypothetical protein
MKIDGTFEVMWGPMRGNDLAEYVKVNGSEHGWLYVQPLNDAGEDDGHAFWLSPSAAQGLRPWKPKKKR